jgi:hypothetical protein
LYIFKIYKTDRIQKNYKKKILALKTIAKLQTNTNTVKTKQINIENGVNQEESVSPRLLPVYHSITLVYKIIIFSVTSTKVVELNSIFMLNANMFLVFLYHTRFLSGIQL